MQKVKNNKFILYFYSIFLCLYPILCIYKGIGSITIGDLFLLLFTAIALFKPVKHHKTITSVIFFLFYIILMLLVNCAFSSYLVNYSISILFFRVLKICLYFLSIYICYDKFFDKTIFRKSIVLLGIISSLYLLLQYFFYYSFGIILLGRIPGLNIHLSEYSELDYNYLFSFTFRPFSFFLEPASFCQFMVVPLTVIVFDREIKIKNSIKTIISILFAFSMIMSTSGQGIFYIAVIFSIAIFKNFKGYKKIILILVVLISVILLFKYNSQFQYSVNRLLVNQDAQNARFGSYKYLLDMDLIHLVFGNGYGLTPENQYLAGFPYVVYGTGIIGLVLVLIIYFRYFYNVKNLVSRVLCILFFVMFFGTALFYNYMLFWFFGLILFYDDVKIEKVE